MSAAGDTMTLTALTIALQSREASTLLVTCLVIASLLPSMAIGPALSWLFVRYDVAIVLKPGLLVQALLTLVLAATTNSALMITLFLLINTASVLESPALLTLAPVTKPIHWETPVVYARLALFRNMGAIAGLVLAGALIALGSVQLALVIDAATSLVLATTIHITRMSSSPDPSPNDEQNVSGYRAVAQLFTGKDHVGPAVWMLALAILFTAALPVAQAQFLLEDLSFSPAFFRVVLATYAAGRFTAALFGSTMKIPIRPISLLIGASLLMGLSLTAAAVVPADPVIFVAFFLAGASNTQQVLSIRSIIHDGVSQGRLASAFTSLGAVNSTATLIGVAAGGALIGLTSGSAALLIAGCGTLAATLITTVIMRQRSGLGPRPKPATTT